MDELKVGCRLKIFADDGVYEGNVYAVDLKGTGKDDRVTLQKAICLDSKKSLPPLIHFYTSDIKKFEIVSSPKTAAALECIGPKLMSVCFKVMPAHLKKLQNIDHEKLSYSWQLGTNEKQKNAENATSPRDTNDSEAEYTVINKIDQNFHSTIALLKRQTVIGLAVQGICISRKGQLCWLQVGVKKHSLLFDMLTLGQEGFDLGLREILESPVIQKVVYNCRCMSDMFCHQYNVLLTNVFDIQVAEVTVFSGNNGGCLPWYVNSLPICLMDNLMLKEDDVFFQRFRMCSKEKDESVWAHRPATDEMLDAACKNVKYLCALRCVMMEKLLKDFITATDIYLAAFRDAPDKELADLSKSDALPAELHRLDYRSYRTPPFSRSRFIDNCHTSLDPVLQVSHDGISHSRRRYSTKELDDWNQLKKTKARLERSKSVGALSSQPLVFSGPAPK